MDKIKNKSNTKIDTKGKGLEYRTALVLSCCAAGLGGLAAGLVGVNGAESDAMKMAYSYWGVGTCTLGMIGAFYNLGKMTPPSYDIIVKK